MVAETQPTTATPRPRAESTPTAGIRAARWAVLILAWAFVGCVFVQVFIAGLALFVDGSRWQWHTTFVHVFELLPFLILLCAVLGRLSGALKARAALLVALIFAQYFTANIGGIAAAFHPVIALVITGVALEVAQTARTAVR